MSDKDKRETCFFCGKLEVCELALQDEEGDHPLCPKCADEWLKSDEPWPTKHRKKKPLTLCS